MKTPAQHAEIEQLRQRLDEAEETLRAIRAGEVDALVVEGTEGERVYTLQGADYPYRALIEAIQQGAVSLTADGTVMYANRCFAEMLKAPHEMVIGASVAGFIVPSERPTFETMLRHSHARKSQHEFRFQAKDGTQLAVLVALAPLPLGGANALCMVVTDLTEHQENTKLHEANRRKDEFLAMLAHELRNPLAPIQNAVEVLQQVGSPDGKTTEAKEIIDRQVRQLSHLVDDLLDVSRITLGKVELRKEPVDLAPVLATAIETSRPVIDARGHQLMLSSPPEGAFLEADPTRLSQIISNLVTNAAKYTDNGGTIFVGSAQEGNEVVIRVRDNGMGIPPDLLPHVFDLFTQGDRSLSRSDGGLGIGLTLVRRLVELHGGSVEALSAGTGQGSEFVVRLPALSERASANGRKSARPAATKRGASRSVLVVDDNRDAADSLGMLLSVMRHDVRVAYSAAEALEIARALQPEVVLLDIGLPDLNGYEAGQRLRELPGCGAMLLVALTGYGREEDKQHSRAAGFDHHLTKPVDPAALNTILGSARSVPEGTAAV